MAGDTKANSYRAVLEKWYLQTISEVGWRKFSDLHIDEIDPQITKEHWLQASLDIFKELKSILDVAKYDAFLAIPLECVSIQVDSNFLEKETLTEQLGFTPPSIYVFPLGESNYEETIQEAKYQQKLSLQFGMPTYFQEKNEAGEYYRTLFLKFPSST